MNTHPFGVTLSHAERRMDGHDETGSGFSQQLYERTYIGSGYLRSESMLFTPTCQPTAGKPWTNFVYPKVQPFLCRILPVLLRTLSFFFFLM